VSTQNKQSGPSTKEETKTNPPITVPLRITGVHRTHSSKDQPFPPTIIMPHKGTSRTATLLNITHQMHHNGCRMQLSQWTLVAPEPSTMEEEGEETSEGEEANTTINPPPASRVTPQT